MVEKCSMNEIKDIITLLQIPNLGEAGCKLSIQKLGSPANVLKASLKELLAVEGLGLQKAQAIVSNRNSINVDSYLSIFEKNNYHFHYYFDEDYPLALKQVPDAPLLLFSKGNFDINHSRKIAIVGTRNFSEYGRAVTQELVEALIPYNVQIVSGMAYGIDIIAHRHAVANHIETVGVLAHGLDRLYPASHKSTAQSMMEKGGLLTEYLPGTNPDKYNFPMRNRIVAGLCDMTIVVESKIKGGALITAKLAASYDREVGAIPGRLKEEKSEGCNYLIKRNMAHLIEGIEDIVDLLNWDQSKKSVAQSRLFLDLNVEESKIVDLLKSKSVMHIDELMLKTNLDYSKLASNLLNLELIQIVRSLSGKRYELV